MRARRQQWASHRGVWLNFLAHDAGVCSTCCASRVKSSEGPSSRLQMIGCSLPSNQQNVVQKQGIR